ncbi:MAG: DUF434 domain-containing protein [Candidatus Caldarchaeales archaeon]
MSKISSRLEVLIKASDDLRYLLDRGYNKRSAIKLIGDRYILDKDERLILYRAIYSKDEVESVKKKRWDVMMLKDQRVLIDGFNVLNTVEAALRGEELILCDDGVIRDFSQVYGRYRLTQQTLVSISLMIEALEESKVSEACILYESQISRSGEIARQTREIMRLKELNGRVETTKTVDSILSKSDAVVCTSDSVILMKCKRFFDLAAYIISVKVESPKILELR